MAKAKKLPSGSWRVQVYSHTETACDKNGNIIIDKDGKPRAKRIYESFTSDDPTAAGKREAEYAAAEFALNKRNKKDIRDITFGEALEEYTNKRSTVLSPASIKKYRKIRKSSMQLIMDIKVADLTQEIIQNEINKECLALSPKTVRDNHGIISAVLSEYRPEFRLRTILPKKVRPVIYVPAEHEISKLMRHVKDKEIEIPIMLAAYGGMRRGEIAALDAINISGNIVHVKCAMVETDQNDWRVKSPKSYAGDRFIQYPDFVIDKLPKMGKITPLNPTMISQRFGRTVKSAGLPSFRFHDLRHYHASTLHALGVPDQYIMEKCGWSNDSVLKDVYRHTIQDVKEKMNAVSDDYFKKMQHEMQHEKK